jgi:uncharacterized membrane-anchored protein YitT (DUF2179 family)
MTPFSQIRRRKIFAETRRAFLLAAGVVLAAFGFVVFQAPYNMAAGGLTGIALIIKNFTGWPVGTLYFFLNIPLLVLGFKHLGRWPFVVRTAIAIALFGILTYLFTSWLPQIMTPFPPADDMLLSAVYGGILGGIGGGIVYRSGSSMGGTGIVGRWMQKRSGLPLSQVYIYTDGAILLAMGLVFGWTVTLYGFLILFINGLASDYILEGPSSTRVATIVTNHPEKMVDALMATLGRGASYWVVTGGYSGESHYLVTCTVSRPQVTDLKSMVVEVDPEAFVTIAAGHQAFGTGFIPLKKAK